MASSKAARAWSSRPRSFKTVPRLLCTMATAGLSVIRSRPDGGPIGRHGFFEVALLPQRVAECEIGLGIIRLEADGLPVCGNSIRGPSLQQQYRSKIVVPRRIVRPQLDLVTKQPFGTCEIALLSRNDAKVAKCGSVCWL